MLETKNLLGIVEVVDGVPRLRRRHDPDADRALAQIRGRALAASASVSSAIRERTGRRLWVNAIVVFWNDFPQRCVEHDKIAYVHGRELGAYLEALPARFDDAIRAEITGVLDSLKHEAGATTAT